MVRGFMSAANTGVLQLIDGTMNANVVRQRRIPSLWKLGCGTVFQHDNNPKNTSKMTSALLKKLRFKVMAWPSMVPRHKPY